jgi:hypothetical protein
MGDWAPTQIRWVNTTLASSTGAARVETDLGPAYAKLLGNPEGPQALFCEWIGTRAADWLGLPTFDIAVVDVTEAGLVDYPDGSTSQTGPAFVARAETGTTWGGSADELLSLENHEALAGLVVLDTWLLNCDRYRPEADTTRRNTRNVFLSGHNAAKGKYRLVAMDHTHCFACGRPISKAISNIDRVRDTRLYGHFPEFRPHLNYERVHKYSRRLLDVTSEVVEGFFAGLPPLWSPSDEICGQLAEFMKDRAAFVGDNIRKMLVDQGELQLERDLGN